MKALFTFIGLMAYLISPLYPQLQKNTWFGGFNLTPGVISTTNPYVTFEMAFSASNNPAITLAPRTASPILTGICDKKGNKLLYTNGLSIYGKNDTIIQNGFKIIVDSSFTTFSSYGFSPVGSIFLDFPQNDSLYYLINTEISLSPPIAGASCGLRLNYQKIEKYDNDSIVAVQKNIPIMLDTIAALSIDACRHANGRDWWVIIPTVQEQNFNAYLKGYRRVLITQDTVFQMDSIQFTTPYYDMLYAPQVRFSPDGAKFAIYSGPGILIWDFDRVTGFLANKTVIPTNVINTAAAIEFSNNSRYIYELLENGIYRILHQYDINTSNIAQSLQTIDSTSFWPVEDSTIFDLELGPDDKIYGYGGSSYHVIHNPNLGGAACNLQKQAIQLPMLVGSLPHFPHYNLGALKGSPADSLGLPATYALHALAQVSQGCGGDSGSITLTAGGGVPGYTYLWNTGDTTASLSGLPPGIYSCTITDSLGYTFVFTDTLANVQAVQAVTTATPNSSTSGNGTAGIAAVSGGAGSYTYLWSTGDTATALTGLFKGTYTCTITDGVGCATVVTATVGGIPAGTAPPQITTPLNCAGASTGAVAITPVAGNQYLWSNGATTPALAGLPAGTYTCTITEPDGNSYQLGVTLSAPPAIALVVSSITNYSAAGNGAAMIAVSGGTPPYTYLWNTGATTDSIGGLFKGIYSCTVTDSLGCQATGTTEVDGWAVGVDPRRERQLVLWPQPAQGVLHLSGLSGPCTFRLLDMQGRVVYTCQAAGGEIHLPALPAGVYFAACETDGKTLWQKCAIE